MSATLKSRIPAIIQQASIRAQKAVELAGQEIEFEARSRARIDTGDMAAGIEWRPYKTGSAGGRVVATDWKTVFHEFGTVKKGPQPMLVPAAEHARPTFIAEMSRIYS